LDFFKANGISLLYLAKYANPGYNPSISTNVWTKLDC
jgi:hypothetical protein